LPGDSTSTKVNTSDSLKIFPHFCAAEKADAIRREATMVQNTQNVSLGLLVGSCDTASANSLATTNSSTVLTPTTDKILTELFQSENCIDKLETIENDGFLVPAPPTTAAPTAPLNKEASITRKSFIKLDSSSWQGGTTTVVTPTKSEQLTILDVPTSLTTMRTRSSRNNGPKTLAVVQKQAKSPVVKTTPKKQANVRRTPKSRPGVKATTNEFDLSPEEAQKLKVRRERNKAAAARCRKRRMDQIACLSDEVQVHEEKKMALENTIAQLKAEKEHLEYILSQHQSECPLQIVPEHQKTVPCIAVKSEPVLVETMEMNPHVYILEKPTTPTSAGGRVLKPKRPLSLNIESAQNEAKTSSTSMEGIVIDTPSNVLSSLGFDTLMTSTGLTPTSNIVTPVSFNLSVPSCSSQQRSSEMNLTELNTPASENVSLVSL